MKSKAVLSIITILMFFSSVSHAQTVGLRAGFNISNLFVKDNDQIYSRDLTVHPGFHAGLKADLPFSEIFSLEAGLLLSTRGYRFSDEAVLESGERLKFKEKVNLFYLNVPLHLKTFVPVGTSRIFFAFGPYMGIGLSGRRSVELTVDEYTENADGPISWGTDIYDDEFKHWDFGLDIGAGVEVNSLQLGVYYGLGLANISTVTPNGLTIQNRVWSLSVGYRIQK